MTGPAAADLDRDLAAAGFLCLGGLAGHNGLELPSVGGRPARALLLVGSTGPSIWPRLKESPEFGDGAPDPLDRYTRRVLTALAAAADCTVVFPFDGPPYHPFQQWALKCGGFSHSPMGVLAHHAYGPWAGFRATFLFADRSAAPETVTGAGPCPTCPDKPCIAACPAGALSLENGYDVPKCRDHLVADQASHCRSGCLARRACPYGQEHRQDPANARFHMDSFIAGMPG
ncbi:MAG: 4Fe-4S dicluster domain-containing protein [Roseibium sp.]